MPPARRRGRRPAGTLRLLGGLALAAAAAWAGAAELIVSGAPADLAAVRSYAGGWEAVSGNRLIWLESESELVEVDVYVLDAAAAVRKAGQIGALALRPPAGAVPENLAPLLVAGFARPEERAWNALPLAVRLPVLHIDRARLAQRGLSLPKIEHWQDVVQLARQLSDPIGDVHGLCVAPQIRHATVLRAMLADAGRPWRDEATGAAFAGEHWLAAAESYARLMARAGPANAARLDQAQYAQLNERQRCAMRLELWRSGAAQQTKIAAAVPGAAAFVAASQRVLMVAAASSRAAAAADFAWWLTRERAGGIGVRLAPPPASAGEAWGALRHMLLQPGAAAFQLAADWHQLDEQAQAPLAQMLEGAISARQALDQASAALAQDG